MKNNYDDYSWSFLAASPSFGGAFFEEAVILLLEDSERGSFGVIVNKPIGKTIGELGGKFENELNNVEVFEGGPISPERISLAVCCDNPNNESSFSFGATPEKALEIMKKNESARVAAFAGYAEWSPHQLQREINEGIWVVSNAEIDYLFELPPSEIWKQIILKEMPQFQDLERPQNTPELN